MNNASFLAVAPEVVLLAGALVVIILGGLGNIQGGIMAGFLLAILEIYAVTIFSAEARSILIYGSFVCAILLRPQGLLGVRRRA